DGRRALPDQVVGWIASGSDVHPVPRAVDGELIHTGHVQPPQEPGSSEHHLRAAEVGNEANADDCAGRKQRGEESLRPAERLAREQTELLRRDGSDPRARKEPGNRREQRRPPPTKLPPAPEDRRGRRGCEETV